ncbi:MAG: hypothetical protein IEMM0002_0855 [bacterium]|nr:MAG: hypothetical protein IEMM0002_0855 [bacterium]
MIAELNEKLFWFINAPAGMALDVVMIGFTVSGYAITTFLIGIAAMRFYKNLNGANAILLAAAIVVGGAVVHGIKQAVPQDRPLGYYAEHPPPAGKKVRAPFTQLRNRTFPSGHSQTSFGVAVLMALLFRRHVMLWFLWASMVALSRVYLGLHFPIDIMAGSVIGASASVVTFEIGKRVYGIKNPRDA